MKKLLHIIITIVSILFITDLKVYGQCATLAGVVKSHTDITCNGVADGTITVELTDGSPPFNFELYDLNQDAFVTLSVTRTIDPPNKVTFSNVPVGAYKVAVFKSGCPTLEISDGFGGFLISEPDPLTAAATTLPDCDGAGTGSIDLTVTGGTAPYTYTWSNGLPPQEDHNGTVSAGTYAVDIEDANGCTFNLPDIVVGEFTIADAGADQTICDVTATLSGNPLKVNETGTWSSTNPSVIFADVNNPNTTVSGLTAGAANTLTWTVSDNNGICAPNSDDVIITVDEITLAAAGGDQEICIDNTTLAANEPAPGETGEWTVTSGTGTFADATLYNTTVGGLSAGVNEFTWTITDVSGVCSPTSDVVAINFTDLTIADAGADQTVCDVTATLSGNAVKTGETGTWSSTDGSVSFGNINDPNTTVSGLTAGAANTLTWTVSDDNGICAPNSDDVIITVDEITLAAAGGDQEICIDNTTLAANEPAPGETGEWTVTSGTGTFADATLYNTTVGGLSAGVNEFTWTITDVSGVCSPTSDVVAINFTDLTIADAGADQTVCDVTATLSGNAVKTGETGTWSSTDGSVSFGNINDPNTTVSGLTAGAANTLTWTVSDDNGVCASNADDVIITVDEITIANAGADQDICIDNATLSANQAVGTEVGTWTVTSGTGTFADASVHNTTVSDLSPGTNEFTWTITDPSGVCSPTSDVVAINFTDLTIADAGADQTVCDVTATLSGNPLKVNETGTWSSTNPSVIFADVNNPNTTVSGLTVGAANTLTWTVSDDNGVCASNADDVIITVDESTIANAGADQDICIDNATLSANQAVGTEVGTWTVTSGTGTFADANVHNTTVSDLSPGTNEFTWTITDPSGVCSPTSDVVAINFTDLTIADAGADQTVCDITATLSGNTLKAGETGTWSSINPSVVFANVNDPNTSVGGLTAGAANTLTWTVSDDNGICAFNSDDVIITVDEITVAAAGADQDVCLDNTTLAANEPATGETGEWTVTSGSGIFADATLYNTTVSGLSEGVNEFTWTITDASGVCSPTADVVAINFTDLTIADAGANQTICLDNATLSGNPLKPNETGTWSSTNASITFDNINDPNTAVNNLAAGINTLTWTVSDNNGVCGSNADDVIITVDEITIANAGSDQNICIDNTTLTANEPASGETGEWTLTSGTGTFADASVHNTTVSDLSPGVNEFTWTITDPSGVCSPTSDVVAINFTDLTTADAGDDQTVCDVTATLSGNTLKAGETGTWSSINPSVVFANVNDPNTSVGGLTAGAANTLTWTVSDDNGICASNSDDVIITVDEITVADAGADQNVCESTVLLSANPVGSGETGAWTITSGSGVFANPNDPATEVTDLALGLNQFVWTVSNPSGTCPSNADTVNVNYSVIAASASTTDASCTGVANGSIIITASDGTAPYQYSLDGSLFQNSNVFNGLSAGSFTVTVRDANACIHSFPVTINQESTQTASVSVTSNDDEICAGAPVTFEATPTNGGSAPTYQWFINGGPVSGATSANFTTTTLNDGDAVTVEMTAGGTGTACIVGSPATSNTITISVPGSLTASVSITSNITEICPGDQVIFEATTTNGGSNPTYQWFINGSAPAGETGQTFTANGLADGDEVFVEMTAGGTGIDCITGSPAESNHITVTQSTTTLTASVAISSDVDEICAGGAVTFEAAPTNGGSDPTYQWFINGSLVTGATDIDFMSTTLNDGDIVTVEMTAGGTGVGCITGSPATSNGITISVLEDQTAAVTILASEEEICAGASVTFEATPTNGGSAPTYQWYINGAPVSGATSATFTTTTLNHNDDVTVEMTAEGTGTSCIVGSPATSNTITISVPGSLTASVSITSNITEICPGDQVIFEATPTNGGSNPTYQWFINGSAPAGETGQTFAANGLTDGDEVFVEMTVGGTGIDCITGSPAESNHITVTQSTTTLTASVAISSDVDEICAGGAVTFEAAPTHGGSDPTYQWFINGTSVTGATDIDFMSTTLNDGDIVTVEMTAGGTGVGCITGSPATSNGITISVLEDQTAAVTILASEEEICAGASVTFEATPTNGGSAPTYQWFINGAPVSGAISATFTTTTLNHDDDVTVEMTAEGTGTSCIVGSPATSNTITISVPGSITASVSITPTDPEICAGDAVTFTATPTNGGSAPTYQWFVNGTLETSATASDFTTSTLNNNDVVTVEMTAGGTGISCVTGSPAMSAPVTISVPGSLTASVSITPTDPEICAGDAATFTATPTNGGSAPTYQWFINGTLETGATASDFTTSTLNNNDVVTVEMTAGGTGISCVTGSPAMSAPVTISIPGSLTASVSITPTDPEICAGDAVTFTATPTNGGSAPTYQWFINGTSETGATASDFTTSTLNNNDVVTVEMTAGGTGISCVTGSPAMSAPVTISVPGSLTASVSITPTDPEICAGDAVTFTATPTNGGSAPTYQWFVNGTLETGATASDFTTSTLNNNDVVTVEMTAGGTGISCVTGSPAMSAPVTISIPGSLTASVSITPTDPEICAGDAVTFTATPTNGGSAPTYQWFINGTSETGATASDFTTSTLNNNDVVTVEMTAGGTGISCVTGSPAMSAPVTISVPGSLTASVSITPTDPEICAGDAVTFTATPTNGGSAPTYQWFINGTLETGATASDFTTSTLNNNDVVTVEMTAGGTGISCVTGSPAMSAPVTISVPGSLTASVNITPTDPEICAGDDITFTATPTHGGSNPTYQWYINGSAPVGETGATFTANSLSEGDEIFVEMIPGGSGISCVTNSLAVSNSEFISISTTTLTASVAITPTDPVICAGDAVTFTATPSNGGSNPTYQWFVNGTLETGATAVDFTTSTLNNNDVVTVEMTAGGTGTGCITGSPAMSAPVTISVPGSLTASVSITPTDPEICAGDAITFTAAATHGGSAPTYQWYLNGSAPLGETNSTFVLNAPSDEDEVYVEMTPGGSGTSCVAGGVVTSNTVEISFGSQTQEPVVNTTNYDYCEGDAIEDLEATGTDLKWYSDETLTTLVGSGSPFATGIDSNTSGNYSFYVTQTSVGCGESNAVEVTINIDNVSPAPVVGDALVEVCQDAAAPTLTATGNDLIWYSDAALTTSVGSGASYTPSATELDMTVAGITSFYVTQNIGCGEGSATQVTVNVTAQSSTPANYGVNMCQHSAIQPLTVTGTNVIWYADAALATSIGTGNTFTPSASQLDVTTPGSSVFYFTQDTGCGASAAATATVYVIDENDPFCNGGGGTSCGAFAFQFDNIAPTCGGDDGTVRFIDISYNGTTPPFSFGIRKVGDAVFDMVPNNPNFSNYAAGDYEYRVVNLNNDDFCEGTFVLRPETSVIASASNFVNSQCFGEPHGSARIDASESSTGNYFYSLDGSTWHLFIPGDQISGLWPNGTYNIMVGEKVGDTCPALVEVTINNQFSDISLTVESTDATCNVNDGSITLSGISGGLAPYEVALEKAGSPLVYQPFDANTPMHFDKVSQGYHNLIVRDANSCTKTRQILVNAPNLVVFELWPGEASCENDGRDGKLYMNIADFDASVEYKYAITQGDEDPTNFIPIIRNLQPIENLPMGTYKVFITTDGQCINEQEKAITEGAAAVSAILEPSDIQCFGETGSVAITNFTGSAEEKFDYLLLDKQGEVVATGPISPNQTILGFTINNLLRGDYVLQLGQYQTSMNCTVNAPAYNFTIGGPTSSVTHDEVEVEVSLPDQPTGSMNLTKVRGGKAGYVAKIVDFEAKFLDKTDYPTGMFDLVPSLDGISYEVKIEDIYAGTYYLILTDALGCEQEIIVEVDYDRSIFIPNVFTPNGDAFNETFYIRNLPESGSTLVITNRWGKIVYENKDYSNGAGWDGGSLPDGIYYYKLMANDEAFAGWVEIWRGKSKE